MSLSMFGGLAKGFALGRQQKVEREREKELDDLKKQMLKVQAESQKVALEEAKRKNKLVDLLMMGGQEGGGEKRGPTFSENFDPEAFAAGTGQTPVNAPASTGTGFAEQASLMGMMQDPQMVALLKMAGIDIGDAARLSQTQQQNLFQNLMSVMRYNQAERAGTWTEVTDPSGAPGRVFLPSHAGGGGFPQLGERPGTMPAGGGLGPSPRGVMPTGPAPVEEYEFVGDDKKVYVGVRNKTTKQPVPGYGPRLKEPPKPMAGETAGKYGMLEQGLKDIREAKEMILPGGQPDYKLIAQMNFPGGGFPHSTGRTAYSLIMNALEGKLRLESGAAVPEEEVARMWKRFGPSVLDNPATIASKLGRLESALSGTVKALDPNMTYSKDVMSFKAENGKTYVLLNEAPKEALDYLKANPKLKGAFFEKYGYLPEGY